ncbi:MAG: Kae1-associated serine/threonine protein kinase [Candidatus Methanomethylophilus sp.]|nr:Kae1-associated serine/threonine protein kinase [Methanomethylophilus sp.]
MDGAAIAKGAEGSVYLSTYLGRDAVTKVRTPKGYRVPELDRRIRTQRIRSEARLIREARAAGIRTPIIYDVDTVECSITMERVKGVTVKKYLDEHPEEAERICRLIGTNIARLHNSKICHSDLTTSNMILTPAGELCIIDFSMGASLIGVEDMGVDLRLLERGFTSAHPDIKDAYEYITEAYCQEKTGAQEVLDKVQEIKDRGRYT